MCHVLIYKIVDISAIYIYGIDMYGCLHLHYRAVKSNHVDGFV